VRRAKEARYAETLPWPAPARWLLSLLFASVGLPVLLTVRSGTLQLVVGLLFLGLAALVWEVTVLRVRVDDKGLRVGYRLLGETVPHTRILTCKPVRYDWRIWGGFGVRTRTFPPNPPAKLYSVPGDGGAAVQVLLDSGQQLLFSSRDPEAACRAILASRGSKNNL